MQPFAAVSSNSEVSLDLTEGSLIKKWVTKDTAILIIHGIGNQLPLETLDQFGQGLLLQYQAKFKDQIEATHVVVDKPDNNSGVWFDNVLRITKKDDPFYVDVYEYYWANYTEDKSTWKDIDDWLQGVVRGARKFYKVNKDIGIKYKDKSIFFRSSDGSFRPGVYRMFLSFNSKLFQWTDLLATLVLKLVALIPVLGNVADSLLKSYSKTIVRGLTNVMGDIVVYNVNDPKSKFYDIKKRIQEGAEKSLLYIVEKTRHLHPHELQYSSVLVAGHSLGSQVGYDAINHLNLLVNQGLVKNFDKTGMCTLAGNTIHISSMLNGFVTFGCPLDKIIFFLRDNIPNSQYIRQQFLNHFNGFKQHDINFDNNTTTNPLYVPMGNGLVRLFEDVQWRNYYDNKDYVSGALDYYGRLINIDCHFGGGAFAFTHSEYWTCRFFFRDVIDNYLT